MDKTPQKVTKDPKRQKRDKKSHETYMKSLKENILRDNQLSTPTSADNSTLATTSSTDNSTPSSSSSTNTSTTRSSDTYIHGVGIVAVLAIGACVFFAYNKKNSQILNK